MNLYCICVCPLTQIRQLEKKNLAQMDYVDLGPKTEDLMPKSISLAERKKHLEEKKNRAWLVLKQSEYQEVKKKESKNKKEEKKELNDTAN